MEEIIINPVESKLNSYRKLCLLLGAFTVWCYLLRIIAGVIAGFLVPIFNEIGGTLGYALQLSLSALFLQILPAIIGAKMFGFWNKERLKPLYRKPKANAKALSYFPAAYGLGMITNILTLIISFLITSSLNLDEAVNPVMEIAPDSWQNSLVMLVFLVIIAPIFEEFIFRGIILSVLKPYGQGMAIFVSAFMFGAYHGNFQQFFFATVLGIVFGFIACKTNSIFPTTVMHGIINSISGILLLLMSLPGVKTYLEDTSLTVPDDAMLQLNLLGFFATAMFITAVAGACMAIGKLKNYRNLKLPAVWTEISTAKKYKLLILTVPMIMAILLIIDTFGSQYIANSIFEVLSS